MTCSESKCAVIAQTRDKGHFRVYCNIQCIERQDISSHGVYQSRGEQQSDSCTFNSLDGSISSRSGVLLVLQLLCVAYIPVCYANSVDPDQTPRSAASDLGLHCLPMSPYMVRQA